MSLLPIFHSMIADIQIGHNFLHSFIPINKISRTCTKICHIRAKQGILIFKDPRTNIHTWVRQTHPLECLTFPPLLTELDHQKHRADIATDTCKANFYAGTTENNL